MKLPRFDLSTPSSTASAVALLESDPDAKVLAGGQSLLPVLALRLSDVSHLVDLAGIPALRTLHAADDHVSVGAMVSQAELERAPLIGERLPVLRTAVRHVAHRAIRTLGTVGGSVAHADPAAELPTVLTALGASVVVHGRNGERRVAIDDFYLAPFMTACLESEVLVRIDVPTTAERTVFLEFARRPGDFAVVLVALSISAGKEGGARSARVAIGGVTGVPVRCPEAERLLAVAALTELDAAEVAEIAADSLEPSGDARASPEYRRYLARVLVERAVERLKAGADG